MRISEVADSILKVLSSDKNRYTDRTIEEIYSDLYEFIPALNNKIDKIPYHDFVISISITDLCKRSFVDYYIINTDTNYLGTNIPMDIYKYKIRMEGVNFIELGGYIKEQEFKSNNYDKIKLDIKDLKNKLKYLVIGWVIGFISAVFLLVIDKLLN